MTNDVVVFPNHAENIRFSWRTRYFFLTHKIAIETGSTFPLDFLRGVMKEDEVRGNLIYTELYLFGFNFHLETPLPLYPSDVLNRDRVLISLDQGPFMMGKVKNKKLRKLFHDLEVMVTSDLNGMSYERLLAFSGMRKLMFQLEDMGYVVEPWDNLQMERLGTSLLYWPEGREGLALPRFFLPFLSTLLSSDYKLIACYRRVGLRRYGDFFHLNFGKVEYLARLIGRQGLDPYETGLHQLALWTFAYRLEEAKRELNNVGLDERFLFYPVPKGLLSDAREVMNKYLAISIPFARNLTLANSFNFKDLPSNLKGEEALLDCLGIHDLSIFSSQILNQSIETYRVSGTPYREAVNPEFILRGLLDSLEKLEEPHLVTYEPSVLNAKIEKRLKENDPDGVLDALLDSRSFLSGAALKEIPGLTAYVRLQSRKYAYSNDLKVVGLRESIANLEMMKEGIMVVRGTIPFEELMRFYEATGVSPLCFLKENKMQGVDYNPYPDILLEKRKKEKER